MEEVSAFTCNDKKVCEELLFKLRTNENIMRNLLKVLTTYEKIINANQNKKGADADMTINSIIKQYNEIVNTRSHIICVDEDNTHNKMLDAVIESFNEIIECELFDKLMQNSKSYMEFNTEDIVDIYRPNKEQDIKIEEKIVENKQQIITDVIEELIIKAQTTVEQNIIKREDEKAEQLINGFIDKVVDGEFNEQILKEWKVENQEVVEQIVKKSPKLSFAKYEKTIEPVEQIVEKK